VTPGADHSARAVRTELLRALEHDARTPLSVVIGWAETLERGWDTLGDVERRHGIETIARNAQALATWVALISAEARADLIARHLEMRDVDLRAVVQHEVERARTDRLTVTLPDAAVSVHADSDACSRAVRHLLSSALSTTEGPVVLEVRADGPTVRVEVTRDARSADGADDPFAPVHVGGGAGTELELHLVRVLATAMGAALQVTVDGDRAVIALELKGATGVDS
jgi:signal transduction histidine kinase